MKRSSFLKNSLLALGAIGISKTVNATNDEKGKQSFRVGFLTDIHVKPTEIAEQGMKKAFKHVNELTPKVDFIINGGDAIMDGLKVSKQKVEEQWLIWNKVLASENKLPIFHCIGNHDVWGWQLIDPEVKLDKLYSKNWVIEQHKMPNRFYSFEHQNWKFIVLDSTQENNGGYIARLDEEQMTWLEKELNNTPLNQHICIVSHIPIVSFCSAVFYDKNEPNGDWKISRALLHVDSRNIIQLFKKYKNIKCCLSGHIHLQDEVEYLGIKYYCNGAISGNWWKGAFKDFPPAYASFTFSKEGSVERVMVEY